MGQFYFCVFDPQISQIDTDFFFNHGSALGTTQKHTEEGTSSQNNSVPSVNFRGSQKVRIKSSTDRANFAWFFIIHRKHRNTRKKTHFHRIIPWGLRHFCGKYSKIS